MTPRVCSPELENWRSLSATMKREDLTITRGSSAGPDLHVRITHADVPKCVVALVHGYADYAARYDRVTEVWAKLGISTFGIDLRGHGKSGGARGHCERIEDYFADLRELVALIKQREPSLPRVLFAHSFGALVGLSSVVADPSPWEAVALTGAFFGLALEVPAPKKFAGRIASKLLPTLALPSGLSGEDVTHDHAIVHAYNNDPLIFKTATARWFTEAVGAQERLKQSASGVRLPFWLGFGGDDHVASLPAARGIYGAIGSTDKTMRVYDGLFHEILNEPVGLDIAAEIGDWMVARAVH